MNKRNFRGATLIVIAALALQGCVTSTKQKITELSKADRPPRILLMPVDVTLGHMTTGGAFEPQAEWTKLGETHVRKGVEGYLKTQSAGLVEYVAPTETELRAFHDQLLKLHRVVGQSIALFQLHPALQLPTKKDTFDWSLGQDVRKLASAYGADYALFVYMKDSYATAGRVAAMLVGALLGVGLPGGQQVGYASLVDLRSGEIVWFNMLGRGEGDLREEEPAAETVKLLLTNFPK